MLTTPMVARFHRPLASISATAMLKWARSRSFKLRTTCRLSLRDCACSMRNSMVRKAIKNRWLVVCRVGGLTTNDSRRARLGRESARSAAYCEDSGPCSSIPPATRCSPTAPRTRSSACSSKTTARQGALKVRAVPGEDGITALCYFGANVVPSGRGCDAFADDTAARGTRMIIGNEDAVTQLWTVDTPSPCRGRGRTDPDSRCM